jgi:hypothetical protein
MEENEKKPHLTKSKNPNFLDQVVEIFAASI